MPPVLRSGLEEKGEAVVARWNRKGYNKRMDKIKCDCCGKWFDPNILEIVNDKEICVYCRYPNDWNKVKIKGLQANTLMW